MTILERVFFMITLEDKTKETITLYIDMVPYSEVKQELNNLEEDIVEPNDDIQIGKSYLDQFDTRFYIFRNYIRPIVSKLKQYDFVEDCESHPSTDTEGLSNYIHIYFIHPEQISDSEYERLYHYTIRLSDHENKHPEKGPVEEVELVGRKAKNIEKAVMKVFKTKLSDVQLKIKEFELNKYGKQLTFLKDNS